MTDALSVLCDVVHVSRSTDTPGQDEVVVEHPLRVEIDGTDSLLLSCSPAYLEELVTGNLFCRGYLSSAGELHTLSFSPDRHTAYVTRTPAAAPSAPDRPEDIRLPASAAYAIMGRNLSASALFQRTGGVHCVSLSLPDGSLISREDLARHNAVDKIIGHALLHHISLCRCVLAVSGRLSADMMEKAARAAIPIVLSKGAPTDRAIQLARAHGITLAGFIRGERMNLYACPERIDPAR